MRISIVILLALSLLYGAGCGSRQAAQSSASLQLQQAAPLLPVALERSLPSLPPAGHFTPQRATAAAVVSKTGSDFHSADNVSVDSGAALLNAPAGLPAWALYQFNALPGEALGDLSFTGNALTGGAKLWVALADYSSGRWSFLSGVQEPNGSVSLAARSADLLSPGGSVYVLFVVYDSTGVQLDTVSLGFSGRYPVSGTVVDSIGQPVEGVTISTPLFGFFTFTGADGSFTLPELPNGNWPLLAAKHGWTFFDVPHFVTVDNAPVSGVELLGQYSASNFTPPSEPSWNNSADRATALNFAEGPLLASLSIIDDPEDYFTFSVTDPGDYYLQLSAAGNALLFPLLELMDADGNPIENSYYCLRGDICLGFTVADPDTSYLLRVSLSGAGGDYSVSLNSGTLNALSGRLMIMDGEREAGLEAVLISATAESGRVTEYITALGGNFNDAFRLPEMTLVEPQAVNYSFNPTTANANLAGGDVTVPTFAYVNPTIANNYEPNNDLAAADANAVLTLPYNSVDEGDSLALLAKDDILDFYRIDPMIGQGVVARLYLDGNDAVREQFFMYISKGASIILGEAVPTSYGYEVRLSAPFSGGDTYLVIGLFSNGIQRHPYRLEVEEYFPTMVYFDITRNGRPLPNVRVELRDSAYDWRRSVTTSSNGTTSGMPLLAGEEMFVELFRYGLLADRSTFRLTVPPPGSGKIDLDLTTAFDADSNEADDNRTLLDPITLPAQLGGTLEPAVDDNDHYRFSQPVAGQLRLLVSLDDPTVTLTASILNQAGVALDIQPLTDGTEVLLGSAGPGNRFLQLSAGSHRVGYTLQAEFVPAP